MRTVAAISIAIVLSPALGEAQQFDASQIVPQTSRYRTVYDAGPSGERTIKVRVEGDELIWDQWTERSNTTVGQTLRMATGTLALRSAMWEERWWGFGGAGELASRVRVESGRVTGTFRTIDRDGDVVETPVDVALPAGTIVIEQIFALLPALPLAEGASLTVQGFGVRSGTVRSIDVVVEAVEEVTVPAGTFEVFRVTIDGSVRHISTASPRVVVRAQSGSTITELVETTVRK